VMMMAQVAKLFLRGSKLFQGLSCDQRSMIDKWLPEVAYHPVMGRCRTEFCNALRRTIGNEYCDLKVGEEDYLIAVAKGLVLILFGEKANPSVLDNPVSLKKWFQSIVFNYLKQIFRENKYPSCDISVQSLSVPADHAYVFHLLDAMNKKCKLSCAVVRRSMKKVLSDIELIDADRGFLLKVDLKKVGFEPELSVLQERASKNGVSILICNDGLRVFGVITPLPCLKVLRKSSGHVKLSGLFDDDGVPRRDLSMNYNCHQIEVDDWKNGMQFYLPDKAWTVFNILMEDSRPDDFMKLYGDGCPKNSQIAEFLGISKEEVKNLRMKIKHIGVILGL